METQDAEGKVEDGNTSQPEPDTSGEVLTRAELETELKKVDAKWQSIRDKERQSTEPWLKLGAEAGNRIESLEARIQELEQEKEDLISRGDGGVDLAKVKAELRREKKELSEQSKALGWSMLKHQTDLQEMEGLKLLIAIQKAAEEHSVSAEDIMMFSPSTADEVEACAQRLAKLIPKKPAPTPAPATGVGTGSVTKTDKSGIDLINEGLREKAKAAKK